MKILSNAARVRPGAVFFSFRPLFFVSRLTAGEISYIMKLLPVSDRKNLRKKEIEMRKTLALVLSALMLVSLLCVPSFAAEGTAINTAEEFLAMDPAGTYYLNADITVSSRYGYVDDSNTTPFTGTFDGNGHSVTIAAPMFVQFCGTIKNLTINGSASKEGTANEVASYCGAIANNVPKDGGTAVFENIINNAAISGKYRIGGLTGQISSGNTVTLTNCVNNGAVNGGNMVGGLVAYSQNNDITFTNCVNNGKVSINVADSLSGLAGGIIGRFGGDNAYTADSHSTIVIDNCLNAAAIEGTSQAAGILAHARHADVYIKNTTNKGKVTAIFQADGKSGGSDAAGIFGTTDSNSDNKYFSMLFIDRCVNEGDVEAYANRAAGMAGYVWCGGNNGLYMHSEITNCVNKGKITGGSFVSQFLAYTNDATDAGEGNKQPTKIQGVGLGSLERSSHTAREAEKTYFAIVGLSSSAKGANYDYDLTLADSDKSNWVAYPEGTEANRIPMETGKPDTIKIVSATEAQAAAAALGAIGYKAPVTPPATGDAMVWVVVVALVSVLGMGIAVKAKNN